jgi:FkbM family methyltransferase
LIEVSPAWRGIFIEPLPAAFARLSTLYQGDTRFALEQRAISETNGVRPLYYMSPDAGLELFMDSFSSFDRSYVLHYLKKTRIANAERHLAETLVRCEPLMSVLDRNAVKSIDILCTDTEGYDYHVIRQLDFKRFRPKLILYENEPRTNKKGPAAPFLTDLGYRIVDCGGNTLAISRFAA